MDIRYLPKETYKGFQLDYQYQTDAYYQVTLTETKDLISLQLQKESFRENITKTFTSHLYEDYFIHARAYGLFFGETLIGIIEYDIDEWNRRMRITEILIKHPYRNQGYGKQLMDFVKLEAKRYHLRSIILETQTCNIPAIDFYIKNGFHFLGLDLTCYSNQDVEKNEVRLEMHFPLEDL